jgi:ribosomal protein S18 acetylase RimI-like enzyme
VWQGTEIVGQIEIRRDPAVSNRGHVVLFYLIPRVRGSGIAEDLHHYAMELLTQAGIRTAWLRVTLSNTRAVRYYARHGWLDRGPDPEHPETNRMERHVEGSNEQCHGGA